MRIGNGPYLGRNTKHSCALASTPRLLVVFLLCTLTGELVFAASGVEETADCIVIGNEPLAM